MKDNTPWIDVDLIKPHPQNPRNHTSEQIQKIAKSIKELGWGRPIILSKDNFILAGHGAYIAATEKLHLKSVPYRKMVHVHDSPEALSYMIADNKLTDESDWNYGKLEPLMERIEIEGFDLSLTGFEETEIKKLPSLNPDNNIEVIEDDFDPDTEIESIVQPGQIWQLDNHRLMCGDSTIKEDVEKLMNGNKADMVFTDPPYGVEYVSRVDKNRRKPWGEIKNDNLKDESFRNFLHDSLSYIKCPKYVCCNWQSSFNFILALKKPNGLIVWDKCSIGLGKGYRNQHEFILFYGKLDHDSESNVWTIKRDSINEYNHPTQKPIQVPARAIKNSSSINDNVLDLFGGSGSTLIACEQTNRACYMMELDPHYCDVIIKRWEEFTSQKAVLTN